MSIHGIHNFDEIIKPMLRTARIPGAAIAIVAGGKTAFARGYGYRDLGRKLPLTPDTVYPIASTTKAINATLLGMLVDEGKLAWDMPVQKYLPRFRLEDPLVSPSVTVRDLVAMRTGLPRHDFLWMENPIGRTEMVERLAHLPLSAGFRERYQYNNLTSATAGHIAEVLSGRSWEELVRLKILEPLGMSDTGFVLPPTDNVTLSYHENSRRELVLTRRFATELVAPAGGSIHSTVDDMTRWIAFNLNGGKAAAGQMIEPQTLKEIHSPCMVAGVDAASPSPNAAYGLGWFVDTYNGRPRLSHSGFLHNVNSSVMLFPEDGLGIVSFINFGAPRLTTLINEYVFDLIMGFKHARTFDDAMLKHEKRIEDVHQHIRSGCRVENTVPSHGLDDYIGCYRHAGYGQVYIRRRSATLCLERDNFVLLLDHWHYDAWVIAEKELFEIPEPHQFDRAYRLMFETGTDGGITAFSMQFEPAVPAMRFVKE